MSTLFMKDHPVIKRQETSNQLLLSVFRFSSSVLHMKYLSKINYNFGGYEINIGILAGEIRPRPRSGGWVVIIRVMVSAVFYDQHILAVDE